MTQTVAVTSSGFFWSPFNWQSDGTGSLLPTNVKGGATYVATNCLGAYGRAYVTLGSTSAPSLTLDTTSLQTLTPGKCPRVFYRVDGADWSESLLAYSASDVTLSFASAAAGAHVYEIAYVRNDRPVDANNVAWTMLLAVKIKNMLIPDDATIGVATYASDNYFIVGDSLSEGVGVLAAGTGYASNDATQGLAWLLGKQLAGEFGNASFSGMGFKRGINNVVASSDNPSAWSSTDVNKSWDKHSSGVSRLVGGALSPPPRAVVNILGINDSGLASSDVTGLIDDERNGVPAATWIVTCGQYSSGTNDVTIQAGVSNAAVKARAKYVSATRLFTAGAAAGLYNYDTSSHGKVRAAAIAAGELAQKIAIYLGGNMGTTKLSLEAWDLRPAATNGAQQTGFAGTNFDVYSLAFDPGATDEIAYGYFPALNYGSGNVTAQIFWEADTASSGDVIWTAALAAITADTDTQDVETKAFGTANSVTDSHLGTTGQRLHQCSITISNLDSLADGDWVVIKITRNSSSASDTMTGDALLTRVVLSYSDT